MFAHNSLLARALCANQPVPFEGYAPESDFDAESPVVVARLPARGDTGYEALIWEERQVLRSFTALVRSADPQQRRAVELEVDRHLVTVELLHALCQGFVAGTVSLDEPTQAGHWEVVRELSDVSTSSTVLAHRAQVGEAMVVRVKVARRLGSMLVDRPVTLYFFDEDLARRAAKAFSVRHLEAFGIKVPGGVRANPLVD